MRFFHCACYVEGLGRSSVGVFVVLPEDPDDEVVLNVAYSGRADYIVTGDNHLLALNRFKKTRIVTINQMLETLE